MTASASVAGGLGFGPGAVVLGLPPVDGFAEGAVEQPVQDERQHEEVQHLEQECPDVERHGGSRYLAVNGLANRRIRATTRQ